MKHLTSFSKYLVPVLAQMTLSAVAIAQSPAVTTYDQVRPVFVKHCVSCHGAERPRGDLNLSTPAAIRSGSSSGVVAVAGKSDDSLLYTLAAHLEAPKMPPGKAKIPQRELDLIRKWIDDGMQERTEVAVAATDTRAKTMSKPPALIDAVKPLSRRTAITALATDSKATLVAVSGQQQVLLIPNRERTAIKAFPFPEGEVHSLRFSRDDKWLLAGGGVGGESGKVVGFEVATGRRLFEVGSETDVVLAFDLSPDRSLVALGGPGKTVKIHRTADGVLVNTLQKHTDWILSVAFSPDGLLLASGDRFGGLQVWEAGSGRVFQTLRGHVGSVNTLVWSNDSDRLLSGGQDGTLRMWDLHQGTQLQNWNAEVGGVLAADWTQANQIIVGGRSRKVAVFDATGQRLREWSLADEVVEIAAAANGSRVIVGDAAGNLSAWTVSTATREGEFVLPVAPQVAQVQLTVADRKQRSKSISSTPSAKLTAKPTDTSSIADAELAATLEALASMEAAVKSAEESLEKLRSSAKKLKATAVAREALIKQAAQRTQHP